MVLASGPCRSSLLAQYKYHEAGCAGKAVLGGAWDVIDRFLALKTAANPSERLNQ